MSGKSDPGVQPGKISNLPGGVSPDAVRQQLEKILSSRLLVRSARLRRFLRFTVEGVLRGEGGKLKEYVVGVEVFDRGDGFDPRADAIVRTEATRLRKKLAAYYQTVGREDPVAISLPRGGYVPLIKKREDRKNSPAPESASPGGRRARWAFNRPSLAVAIGFVIVASAAAIGWRLARVNPPPAQALDSVPLTSLPGWEGEPALSPDGDQVAFIWNGGDLDNYDVYLKLIHGGPPLRLTADPARESCPVWSPDGGRIAFLRITDHGADLFEMPALGGPERRLAKLSMPSHKVSWSLDGRFLAVEDRPPGESGSIFLVSASTGETRRLTTPPAAHISDQWPAFSPDGRALAFARGKGISDVYVLPLNEDLTPAGDPRRLTRDPVYLEGLDWSPDGRAVVFSAMSEDLWWHLWKVAAGAKEAAPEPIPVTGESPKQPSTAQRRIGSQGRLVYVSYSSDNNIYQVPGPGAELEEPHSQGSAPRLIVGSSRYDTAPNFSPGGGRIVFVSDRSGNTELWVADNDGSNPHQITAFRGPPVGGPRWSPDGERIVFNVVDDHMDVYVVNAGGGPVRRLTTETSNEGGASWSRDGRWIYFVSDLSGRFEIRKMPAEGGSSVRIVDRGLPPFESPDGKWIYYPKSYPSQGDPGIWRIPVAGGEEEKVLEEGVSGSWGLSRSGIYLLKPGGPNRLPAIERFRYGSWERDVVFEFPKLERFGTYNALAVSGDDRSIMFVQYDQTEGDLMLVNDFR